MLSIIFDRDTKNFQIIEQNTIRGTFSSADINKAINNAELKKIQVKSNKGYSHETFMAQH